MSSSRGSRLAGRLAVVLGVLAALTVPGAIAAAQELSGVTLLHALYVATPVSVALGLLALMASRRARLAAMRSVRPSGTGSLRAVRITAWTGLYVGLVAALALGFYGVLVALGG
jgi:hypothetical protein